MFEQATKEQALLRAALYGPSGGGKTFTMLRIGTGIAEAIGAEMAVIDSERKASAKYSDKFKFKVKALTDKTTEGYIDAINEAAKLGFGVLGIDSTSHAWRELVQQVDDIAAAQTKGNTWAAWKKGTPKQEDFINAILDYPGHVICTMRSKTEWEQVEGPNGKKTPTRVGLAPIQGKGIEYEFDLLLSITPDHIATVEKDRTGKFQDKIIKLPGEDFGRELVEWLNTGAPAKSQAEQLIEALGEHEAAANAFLIRCNWIKDGQTFRDVASDRAKSIINRSADFISKINAQ